MPSPNYMGLPEDLVARLDPARVRNYVRATGWTHVPSLDNDRVVVFQHPASDLDQLLIPLSRSLRDYNPRMAEVVAYVAEREGRPAADVLHELLLPPSDRLHFHEEGPAADRGDVPLDHGLALLNGARKLLLAAACGVSRPGETFYPRTNLAEAEQFLRTCRLAQADGPGFTATVACPLAGESLFEQVPYARRVTDLLMRSLRRLERAAVATDAEGALGTGNGQPLLSANLCEALLDMTPTGEGSALVVTAAWDRMMPPTEPGEFTVRLRREDFPFVEGIARRLRPAPPPEVMAWLGLVETLNGRLNAAGRVEGEVLLTVLDPEGEPLRARVDLDADDYAAAADAHLRAVPVSLQGVLHRGSRVARIDGVAQFKVYPRMARQMESA